MVGSFHSRKFTAFRFRKISAQWGLKFWSHSDTSFYAKVDKDLTFINQNIVKNTANDLRAKQEFPTTAKNLTITTPRTSCIYFLPKIHKPNNPGQPHRLCLQLSHRIYFQLFRQNYGIYRQKFTIIHQRQPTFAIFREFNIFSQNKLTFSVDITSLYTVTTIDERFPKALLRNLALKHY